MLNKLALAATAAVALLGLSHAAHAAPTWHLSEPIANVNPYCLGTGTGIITQVGYYGETAPRVGHIQDAAVVITVKAGCGPVTAIPDFRLQPGVVARDATQQVECTIVRANGAREPLATTSTGGCSQVPLANPNNFANVYGWSQLEPAEQLEVYLPVTWLMPYTNTVFSAAIRNNNLTMLFPAISFNVDSGVRFDNFSITQNSAGTQASASFALYNFYNGGDVAIEYSTTSTFGIPTLVSAPVAASNAYQWYPSFAVPMQSLTPGTTYYWRARIITPIGTFRSAAQSFTTNATILNPNPPPVYCWRRYAC